MTSVPLKSSGDEEQLDRGEVHVHLGVMRELTVGTKRLDLGGLLDPIKVFDEIRKGRSADHVSAVSRQLQAGVNLSTLVQTGQEVATKSSSDESRDRKDDVGSKVDKDGEADTTTSSTATGSKDGQSTERKDTFSRSAGATAPASRLDTSLPSAGGLSASYHHLLYATADTVLGGRALESLYNIEAIPKDTKFFSVPVVVSFEPGRVTRVDYSVEAKVEMLESDCGLRDVSIVAVAPAGFATFANEASLLADSLRASIAAAIPFGALVGDAQISAALEKVEKFAAVARRPEFQVSMVSNRSFKIRYLGTERLSDGKSAVDLSPVTFDAELLLIGKFGTPSGTKADPAACLKDIHQQLQTLGVDSCSPRKEPGLPTCASASSTGTEATDSKDEPRPKSLGQLEVTFDRLVGNEERVVSQSPTVSPAAGRDAYSVSSGALTFVSTWEYRPLYPLASGFFTSEKWSEDRYGDSQVGYAPVYQTPEPGIAVGSVSAAPGPALLVETKGPSSRICLCLLAYDEASQLAGAAALQTSVAPRCFEKAAATSRTLLFPLTRAVGKGAVARVAAVEWPGADSSKPLEPACRDKEQGWTVFAVKPAEGISKEEPAATLTLRSASAVLETDTLAVRLDLEGPLVGEPKVRVNGTVASVRSFAGRKNGGVVYVTVAQKVARKDEHERVLYIDVVATKVGDEKPPKELNVSTELRAKW
jgi:hypothetical protein